MCIRDRSEKGRSSSCAKPPSSKVAGDKSHGAAQDFRIYARRLVKDLELKGTIRTAVEGVNLSLHWNDADILVAECIRTFPTVTFPATLLLKREEAETNKQGGVQKKELGITDETRVQSLHLYTMEEEISIAYTRNHLSISSTVTAATHNQWTVSYTHLTLPTILRV